MNTDVHALVKVTGYLTWMSKIGHKQRKPIEQTVTTPILPSQIATALS